MAKLKKYCIPILVFIGTNLLACRKDNSCSCTYTDYLGTHTKQAGIIYGSNRDAGRKCEEIQSEYSAVKGYYGVSCKLDPQR
jgi:hypothetical protein